jgi:hypothetical protein
MAHDREDHAAGMGRRGALARLGWGAGMLHDPSPVIVEKTRACGKHHTAAQRVGHAAGRVPAPVLRFA